MKAESTTVECGCGACYERCERQLPIKDIGIFNCEQCGDRIEIWSGRTVPVFKRLVAASIQKRSA
ncbi:MAG: hypothetical protein AB7T59_01390 [Hyphomonadaceae bacterium]